jgi:2-oxoglutarate dehydrogenase E1 component
LSQLIMLLPHGFEGQGPEHCSARLERFLTLCAEHNMQVTQPSTPAQYFHLLRRQVLWKWAKPLIVLTPKSLLRHPMVLSNLEEFSSGSFRKILPDDRPKDAPTKRVIMSSGKAYYELWDERKRREASQVALVRIEQYYPLSPKHLMDSLSQYADGTEVVWFQDEPANMGAWQFMKVHFVDELTKRFQVRAVTRAESASPSTGSARAHKIEHDELLEAAFKNL